MAATDKLYRNQKMLDVTFAVSGILMLLSVIAMFSQDYFRDFKVEQRRFRDVEWAMAERSLLDLLPQQLLTDLVENDNDAALEKLGKYFDDFTGAETTVADAREAVKEAKKTSAGEIRKKQVAQALKDAEYRSVKATYDSKESLYNIAVDERDNASPAQKDARAKHAEELRKELEGYRQKRDDAQRDLDKATEELHEAEAAVTAKEMALTQAETKLKRIRADLDRADKLQQQKRWKITDWVLSLPVIDGFASPYRIQQYTLSEYPIDYSFKYVTRYDRCTTCHLGMEKASYEPQALKALVKPPEQLQKNLAKFQQILAAPPEAIKDSVQKFKAALAARKSSGGSQGGFDLADLPTQVPTVPASQLTDAHIKQFAAHPRLDLFIDSNSPHPAEKFGCTSCHSGQGSATDFFNAVHTPDNAQQTEHWEEAHGWAHSHDWDYQMLAKRFTESTCLKCHHQVTDLVRYGNQVEAPKVVEGYNLVREYGCFGCHEIAGTKRARSIGPDLRLEPSIPLDKQDPIERAKAEADKDNPPGWMRKVGPSLFRVVEKTNEEWIARWIWNPRGFRPDTRMPHFYGLSNNTADALPNEQKDFPSAEVQAIAHYLVYESQNYLKGNDVYRRTNLALQKELEAVANPTDAEMKELKEVKQKLDPAAAPLLELRLQPGEKPHHIEDGIVDADGKAAQVPDAPKDADGKKKEQARGRKLFAERGCLACHSHEGTARNATPESPSVVGESEFGPNLSHVAAKLGVKPGDEASARRWLVQWILNPQVHHPRTRMPYTHLKVDEAAAVASWLLSEGKDNPAEEVPAVANPLETYKRLARVYLSKIRNPKEVEEALGQEGGVPAWVKNVRPDSDEAVLAGGANEDTLKLYVGRKAINRMGCFGCHNVPGFETAKPIGTPLNDWGKKDPERLAFEDIVAYVYDRHSIVERRDDKDDPAKPSKEWSEAKEGKPPYEKYFSHALEHHQREGFLNQKLLEPRSYDYHRDRAWDDRLRMPQFKFAHVHKGGDEDEPEYDARKEKVEAEAREAVMTFVLGLVAEPVPAQYLYNPPPDKLAEIKGRKVLEQFNCVGCHQVRPGVYTFKPTPDALERLENSYKQAVKTFASDYGSGDEKSKEFTAHNAWKGLPPPWPDRLLARGVFYHKVKDDEKEIPVTVLAEALRYVGQDREEHDIPAGSVLQLPDDTLTQSPPLGGNFAHLMVPYLMTRNSQEFKKNPVTDDSDDARAVLPPQLFRQGERTQPEWLFRFLRDPSVIRPQTRMLLRMPRFNMSDDEARALVNYFGAANRLDNPGIGLEYPYLTVKEQGEDYWRTMSRDYAKRLGADRVKKKAEEFRPFWEQALRDRLTDEERKLAAAEELVKAAKEADAKKKAEQDRDALQKEVADLKGRVEKKDVTEFQREWEDTGIYLADAYRLLANSEKSPCLACHQVGHIPAKEDKGPPLSQGFDRLRPDWVERWLANPSRMMHPTIMPVNFPRDKDDFKNIFDGTSLEQARAARDVLLNYPKVFERPENRYYQAVPGGGK